MFFLSQNLTENLSAEGFYQLEWDQTVIDNCGTFFSQTDVIADGCSGLPVGPVLDQNAAAQAAWRPSASTSPTKASRSPRRRPRCPGQRPVRPGTALVRTAAGQRIRRLLHQLPQPPALHRRHRQPPHRRLRLRPGAVRQPRHPLVGCNAFLGSATGQTLVQGYRLGTPRYHVDYPEDIRLYGLSFSTSRPPAPPWRDQLPAQPAGADQPVDLITAGIGVPALTPVLSSGAETLANGVDVSGYRRGSDPGAGHRHALLRPGDGRRAPDPDRRGGPHPYRRSRRQGRPALRPQHRLRPGRAVPGQRPVHGRHQRAEPVQLQRRRLRHERLLGLPRQGDLGIQRPDPRRAAAAQPGLVP